MDFLFPHNMLEWVEKGLQLGTPFLPIEDRRIHYGKRSYPKQNLS